MPWGIRETYAWAKSLEDATTDLCPKVAVWKTFNLSAIAVAASLLLLIGTV